MSSQIVGLRSSTPASTPVMTSDATHPKTTATINRKVTMPLRPRRTPSASQPKICAIAVDASTQSSSGSW